VIPTDADRRLFMIAPYFAFIGVVLTFIVLPLGPHLIVADLDIGLLFLGSVTSLVVVSILMGGWSSNSKWSLLGGMRSAAQIISYELPASMALLTVATMTGSLSTQRVIEAQGGAPWHWNVFKTPFGFVCFFIYFISALAEGNRTPFDLPEAESELVSGYNTEYSGFRFGIYPMVEWVNLYVVSAVATTAFLGGWRLPHVPLDAIAGSLALQLLATGVFLAKVILLVFVIIWIRWTLPRFRVDQMMSLCWKYFIPISLACFLGVTAWLWLVPSLVQEIVSILTFLVGGVGVGVYFASRVRFAYRSTPRPLRGPG
jgi:NADH-quinone oxidoreductase subunit H